MGKLYLTIMHAKIFLETVCCVNWQRQNLTADLNITCNQEKNIFKITFKKLIYFLKVLKYSKKTNSFDIVFTRMISFTCFLISNGMK